MSFDALTGSYALIDKRQYFVVQSFDFSLQHIHFIRITVEPQGFSYRSPH